MDISTVTEKGQATIPARVRKALGLKKGDRVLYERLPDGRYALRALPKGQDAPWMQIMAWSVQDELNDADDEKAYGKL